jgi:hypothetical protein
MGLKRPRRRLPDEIGLTNWSIGIAKGKRRRIYEDPYARGERSGKHAKPDAHVHLALPVPPALPVLAPRALPLVGIPGPFPMPGPFPLAPPPALAPQALPLAGVPGLFPPTPLPMLAPLALIFPFPPPPAVTNYVCHPTRDRGKACDLSLSCVARDRGNTRDQA